MKIRDKFLTKNRIQFGSYIGNALEKSSATVSYEQMRIFLDNMFADGRTDLISEVKSYSKSAGLKIKEQSGLTFKFSLKEINDAMNKCRDGLTKIDTNVNADIVEKLKSKNIVMSKKTDDRLREFYIFFSDLYIKFVFTDKKGVAVKFDKIDSRSDNRRRNDLWFLC